MTGLQFLTNPLTAAPVYYLTYRVGLWLITHLGVGAGHPSVGTRVNALVLGGVVVGLLVGVGLDLLLRFGLWEAKRLRERHRALDALPRQHHRRQQVPAARDRRALQAHPPHRARRHGLRRCTRAVGDPLRHP